MFLTRRDDIAKRKGNYVNLQELYDDVGRFLDRLKRNLLDNVECLEDDMVRYWFCYFQFLKELNESHNVING